MTRSEDELRVGTVRRPSELVRLKKYVVTEPVTPEISAGEHEVALSEEEVLQSEYKGRKQ